MPRHVTAQEISDWCREHVAQILGRPGGRIDLDAKLTRLGLDSATSVYLIVGLEEWLDVELGPELAFEHPTLRKLSDHIAGLLGRG